MLRFCDNFGDALRRTMGYLYNGTALMKTEKKWKSVVMK
jgi:hypothetical protein